MDEILQKLAEQTGLDLSTARNGLGAVLAFLKQQLPAGMFGQVENAVPDTSGMIDSFEENKTEPSASSGLLGAAAGMIGKLFGGGGEAGAGAGAGQLMAMLSRAGLNLTQIPSFLPKVLELLQDHLPPDLAEKIKGMVLPGADAAPAEKA